MVCFSFSLLEEDLLLKFCLGHQEDFLSFYFNVVKHLRIVVVGNASFNHCYYAGTTWVSI